MRHVLRVLAGLVILVVFLVAIGYLVEVGAI